MTEPGLRILVVNWQDRENPWSGGAETHLHEIFGRLASWGHDVTLLCSGWPGCARRTTLDGMDVHRVGGRYTFSLHARRYFRRELAGRSFDVVVEDLNKVPLFTPRWSDRPVVLLVHHLFGLTAFQEANPLLAGATWLLERPLPRVFRGVPTIAISESTARDLRDRGLETDRLEVVPNGIDTDFYTPGAGGPDGDEAPEPSLVFLGRIRRYKRVDLVLRALAVLREGGGGTPGPRFDVVGKGTHEGPLRKLTRKLGLEETVRFRGFVPEKEKRELLRRAWVHVLTSPKEGWGISNIEAAACGTPSVASDSPGLRESVRDGETGFLVPHGDVEALADRLEELLTDRTLRRRMGRAALTFAQGFSWDASARRILAILEGAAARRVEPVARGTGPA